jgi:hypothetical protein
MLPIAPTIETFEDAGTGIVWVELAYSKPTATAAITAGLFEQARMQKRISNESLGTA